MRRAFIYIGTVMVALFLVMAGCVKDIPDVTCVEKIDPECACYMIYAPVCGCNQKTYTNDCVAECSGIDSYTSGPCK